MPSPIEMQLKISLRGTCRYQFCILRVSLRLSGLEERNLVACCIEVSYYLHFLRFNLIEFHERKVFFWNRNYLRNGFAFFKFIITILHRNGRNVLKLPLYYEKYILVLQFTVGYQLSCSCHTNALHLLKKIYWTEIYTVTVLYFLDQIAQLQYKHTLKYLCLLQPTGSKEQIINMQENIYRGRLKSLRLETHNKKQGHTH